MFFFFQKKRERKRGGNKSENEVVVCSSSSSSSSSSKSPQLSNKDEAREKSEDEETFALLLFDPTPSDVVMWGGKRLALSRVSDPSAPLNLRRLDRPKPTAAAAAASNNLNNNSLRDLSFLLTPPAGAPFKPRACRVLPTNALVQLQGVGNCSLPFTNASAGVTVNRSLF